MQQAIFQNIIAKDMFGGAILPDNSGGNAGGADFSAILLAIAQQDSGVVSMPEAKSQLALPSMTILHKRPLFYPGDKPSFDGIALGVRSQNENPPHIKSLMIQHKEQVTGGQEYGYLIAGQAATSPIPQSIINLPSVDQSSPEVDMTSSRTYEGFKPSADSPLYRGIGINPATKSVVTNSYNATLLDISSNRQYQIHSAGVKSSPAPEPSVPELFKPQEHDAESKRMGVSLPGPITGAQRGESVVLKMQPAAAPPENSVSSEPMPAHIAPPIAETPPQPHNTTEIPVDQGLHPGVERQQKLNLQPNTTPAKPDNIAPAPRDNQIVKGALEVENIQQSKDISSTSPPSPPTITADETFTAKDVTALLGKMAGEVSFSVEVKPNIPEPSRTINSVPASIPPAREIPIQRDLVQPVPDARIPQRSQMPIDKSVIASTEAPEVSAETNQLEPVINIDAAATQSKLAVSESVIAPVKSLEVPVETPQPTFIMGNNTASNVSVKEVPIQNNPEQPIYDTPVMQRSEPPTGEFIMASAETPEPSPVVVQRRIALRRDEFYVEKEGANTRFAPTENSIDTGSPQKLYAPETEVGEVTASVPSAREIPIQPNPVQPDVHLPTGGNLTASVEAPKAPAEAPEIAPIVDNNTASTPPVGETAIQHDPIQPVPDTPVPPRSEFLVNENEAELTGEREIKAESPQLAPAMSKNGQNNQQSFVANYPSDRGTPVQREPEMARSVPEIPIKGTVDQAGNIPNNPEIPVEQSAWTAQESSEPHYRERKTRSVSAKRNVGPPTTGEKKDVGPPTAKKVNEGMSETRLRVTNEDNAVRQVENSSGKSGQEIFNLKQTDDGSYPEVDEKFRYAHKQVGEIPSKVWKTAENPPSPLFKGEKWNSKMEVPTLDAGAVERGAWLETPGLRNSSVDMTSSLQELPDRVSTYVNNLVTSNGESSILIQLEPNHLGKIKFRVSLKGNKISAKLCVDCLETKEIIEMQLPDIRRSLVQHQVEVANLSVSVDNGSFGSDLRQSGFSDKNGSDARQTYEQEDDHEAESSTEQNIMDDGRLNLLI